ncbi:MAG: peptide chain release factor N(5)-glutamine methyltransferase [Candidatus Omnitrophota bacterium]
MNEAEVLFTEILNCNRLALYLDKDRFLNNDQVSFISGVLKRRIQGEPIQHILGKTEFMGLEFKITPDVFIPRSETEILVERAIKIGYRLRVIGYRLKVLDIGTGCGNIAISMAKILPYCKMDAIDISDTALGVALLNAKLNNVKINFIQSDLLDTYNLQPNTYDLIISNPPYIPSAEIDMLEPEIKYEPRIALDGGKEGLDFYLRIINDAPHYLKRGGFLVMEMGFNQKEAIKGIFQKSPFFEIIEIIKDYNNIDRIIVAQN